MRLILEMAVLVGDLDGTFCDVLSVDLIDYPVNGYIFLESVIIFLLENFKFCLIINLINQHKNRFHFLKYKAT